MKRLQASAEDLGREGLRENEPGREEGEPTSRAIVISVAR